MSGGRPTDYTEEMAGIICERTADGESLKDICSAEGMPNRVTVYRWLAKHELFRNMYAQAKDDQAEALFDDILSIADDGRNDWMEKLSAEGEKIGWAVNGEHIQRSRVRIDARKWMASKLLPKKFGEKIVTELTGKDGGPIETKDVSARDAIASKLTRLAARSGAAEDPSKPDGSAGE